jgi:hypothetical protein
VHQGDVRIQEPDNRDLADELGPLEVCFKESLVERGDLLPSFEVRSMVSDALACWSAAIVGSYTDVAYCMTSDHRARVPGHLSIPPFLCANRKSNHCASAF